MLPWIYWEVFGEIISTNAFIVLKLLAFPQDAYLSEYVEISIILKLKQKQH